MTRRLQMHQIVGEEDLGWTPGWICDHCGRAMREQARVMWNAESQHRTPQGYLALAEIVGACGDVCEAWIRANVSDVASWGTMPIGEFVYYLMSTTNTEAVVAGLQADLALSRTLRHFNEQEPTV